ncbi:SDR family NAD(P)-dependent oxidoreductase [Streptomyces fuscichromogenes]|uniref:SDR family NAD(P)-dependent oxidoreductase n=1 Tax=Streptomyces fuscichromogenes TaxID=1324013 RepID=A0A918CX75_9ACTN|nr:SDR family NAD(P)-dependent oxidoreductase [Streptomyces fuscichromogenes]GGN43857.1 hypothetical protein GCM10011578_094340 [Streptomyces fuscichromogenes]
MSAPDRRFQDRVALITGASRGIGRALALTLGRGGATVVVNYKKHADLAEKTVAELEEAGGRGLAVQADVETVEGVESLFAAVRDEFGRLNHFVSNAAASAFKNILDLKPRHLEVTWNLPG